MFIVKTVNSKYKNIMLVVTVVTTGNSSDIMVGDYILRAH